MAESKNPFLFCVLLALTLTKITTEPLPDQTHDTEIILDQLKSKLLLLELTINERARELRSKDESIRQMEKIIQEKSESITLLHSEIESLQKDQIDAQEQTGSHVGELDKQLQKVNDEKNIRIREIEQVVQVTQEEMTKSKLGADSMSSKLNEVHREWLPNSLAVHFGNFQHYITTYWIEHGRPALEVALQKGLQTKAQVDKWAEPHIETISATWIPMLKKWWLTNITYLGPCFPSITSKTMEHYHTSKHFILHYAVNVQEMAGPCIEEAKQLTHSFIDRIATFAGPHFDEFYVVLNLYTRRIFHAYKNFIKSVAEYHHQVRQILKDNELTRPLATMELAWFLATTLLALPVVFMFKLFSSILRKKAKKHLHRPRMNHVRRGAKRSHPAK